MTGDLMRSPNRCGEDIATQCHQIVAGSTLGALLGMGRGVGGVGAIRSGRGEFQCSQNEDQARDRCRNRGCDETRYPVRTRSPRRFRDRLCNQPGRGRLPALALPGASPRPRAEARSHEESISARTV
jgi:hypothetical protein